MRGMNRTTKQMLRWIVVIFLLVVLLQMFRGRSGYVLKEISINAKNNMKISELPYTLECVPGGANGSPYTKDLTPGGVCGIQKLVAEQSEYELVGGIGEPLI